MILFVDLEHPRLQSNPQLWELSRARLDLISQRLAAISGAPCLTLRYDDVTPDRVGELSPRAVVVSGCYTDYIHYDPQHLAGLHALYLRAPRPLIGFCAGMQLMAEAHGATLGPIGFLAPGEPDPTVEGNFPAHVPGMIQERGFLHVEICAPSHPLLGGLPVQPIFYQSHYWEVKTMPAGFDVLARSPLTPIQAIAHVQLPLFGVQFHPEQYDEKHTDGKRVLENFFELI